MFTQSVEQMSDSKFQNTHEVLSTLFHALDLEPDDREKEGLPQWTKDYPYVNGSLFAGTRDVPKFSRIARSYLIHAGNLNWKEINPDIFGSMIQAVEDDEERGSIGMHYTSVPNILKVLNPLFLDDLKEQLKQAGDNARKLLNLKKRISKIRVFDPACGSGNFLVIAYKEMRAIEFEIKKKRKETHLKSEIPLSNFRGIEIREFPTEIARLALIIAEYQCDELYRGQKDALADFLPLDSKNWIVTGNALRLDWLSICPSTEISVEHLADDLFSTPVEQAEVDFENEGGETFICGNPPYLGSKRQGAEHKSDLGNLFEKYTSGWKSLDYVAGWFMKAADFVCHANSSSAFVSTNSINQGQQTSILWPLMYQVGVEISFAHTSFKWANLASHNAGVTVVIVGLSSKSNNTKTLSSIDERGKIISRLVRNINPYLIPSDNVVVNSLKRHISDLPEFYRGNSPTDDGNLLLDAEELKNLNLSREQHDRFIRTFVGSQELIRGLQRYCIWIEEDANSDATKILTIAERIRRVKEFRLNSKKSATVAAAEWAHRFDEQKPLSKVPTICVPVTSSENREYLPVGLLPPETAISNSSFGMPSKELWVLALVASRMSLIWVATVCSRMRTDYRFTNTLAWNTFAVPTLTEKNKLDLKRCAEDILLAREAHFPKTIADLYNPNEMPENLKQAHERNDETLERIYIGRRFKNDTERLEKLFELYTKMTTTEAKNLG